MNRQHVVFTETASCQDCYKCLRQCLVKAIKIENGSAGIISDACISCGHCVSVCPSNAKQVRNDIGRVKFLLKNQRQTIVTLAPSYVSEFENISPKSLITGLKRLGFDIVTETALGADIVSKEIAQYFNSGNINHLNFSSACPVVVDYIQKYKPEFAPYISKLLSPLLAHCTQLKHAYGNDIGIVFVGPCIAKKNESDQSSELLDVALTFEELRQWFEAESVDLSTLSVTDAVIQQDAGKGKLYPLDGGMVQSIQEHSISETVTLMSYSGMNNIKNLLDNIVPEEITKPLFLELLACENGCVNGPMTSKRKSDIKKRFFIEDYYEKSKNRKDYVYCNINRDYQQYHLITPEFSEDQIFEMLKKLGKRNKADHLNCSACGYNTCREFALACLAGKAEKDMCLSYTKKMAQQKANGLIKTMPSGVVIVDNDLEIIEANRNFAKICGEETEMVFEAQPGLNGASLGKFINFQNLFRQVLESGLDIIDREIRFNDAVLLITIFTIERQSVIGGIIQDITKPAVQKSVVLEKTRSVIEKNLKTVQQIAYLMGENASETEIILNSIANSFTPSINSDKET